MNDDQKYNLIMQYFLSQNMFMGDKDVEHIANIINKLDELVFKK